MVRHDRPELRLLSDEGVDQIVGEALATLEQVGVRVESPEAVELLSGAGARVADDGERVFLPEDLCHRAFRTVPRTFRLFDRDGAEALEVGDGTSAFVPGSAALLVRDHDAGTIRDANTGDVVRFVHLTDALDAYALQSTGVVPHDMPELLSDRFRLFLALACGRKPVITGTFTKEAFGTMYRLLVAVRGSEEALAERPLAIFDCCPSPPLSWSDLTAQALMDCARAGVPAELVSAPLAGATAPVTLAGTLVQHTAENVSGAIIHQLASPGAPVSYGGSPFCFDMRHGTTPLGAMETIMMDAAYARIGHRLGFPVHAYVGLSDAKSADAQAGLETALGMALGGLAGVDILSGGGMLDFENCQSLEKLVIDGEIAGMVQRLRDGIAFREESVGLEILREAADSGRFLVSEHTRRFFRDEVHYPSEVIDRSTRGAWQRQGRPDTADRAHRVVERTMREHPTPLADEETIAAMEDRLRADFRAHGADSLPDWRSALPERMREAG